VPGAELLDALDDKTYKGKVLVRLGPIALAFVCTAKFEDHVISKRRVRSLSLARFSRPPHQLALTERNGSVPL
jgi:hypothetical protein